MGLKTPKMLGSNLLTIFNMATLKDEFIEELAKYLVEDQVKMSIFLEMKRPDAVQWARLRNLTPLFGYITVEEAVIKLKEFLS